MRSVEVVLAVAVVLVLGVASFWAERRINFAIAYQDMVRETIREMVRPEALK